MSEWSSRTTKHPIQEAVKSVRSLLALARGNAPTDPAGLDALNRLESVFTHLAGALAGLDPELVHPEALGQVHGPVGNVAAEIGHFNANGNFEHLRNANAHADGIVNQLYRLALPAVDASGRVQVEAITNVREAGRSALASVKQQASQLSQGLTQTQQSRDELSQQLASEKQRLDGMISEFSKRFQESDEARRVESQGTLKALGESVQQALETHRSSLADLQRQATADLAALTTQLDKDAVGTRESLATAANALLDDMKRKRDDAIALLDIVSESTLIHGYQKAAQEELKQATFWERVTILAMLAFALFAVIAYQTSQLAAASWLAFTGRAVVAIAFGFLAAYGAREATHHQRAYRTNKRFELELAALGPFLYTLPAERQQEVKIAMAEKMFGRHESGTPGEKASLIGANAKELLALVNDLVKNARS